MADFDPDAFVAKAQGPGEFDPDAFVAKAASAAVVPAPAKDPGDVGAGATFGAHFARHLSFGMGDKVTAAIQAAQDVAHDKTGKVKWADAYKRDLSFNDKALEASDKAHPVARWLGNGAGVVGSIAAPAGALRLLRGAPAAAQAAAVAPTLGALALKGAGTGTALGALGGFGASRADSLGGAAKDTLVGAGTGAALGAVAPVVAAGLGKAAGYVGDKARDFAGWLKVHSLHPVPTLGERMAELPGGEAGVGKELLAQGLGGLTKKGTAEQIDAAGREASTVANRLAQAYDASGAAQVDIAPAIFRAAAKAQELQSEPTTRAAGDKLEQLLAEYGEKYRAGVTSAEDALRLKRALGNVAYGSKLALGNGDTLAGRYGEGVSEMQHGVDDALDSALGPQFAEANLRVRRLIGASQAAERSAGRAQTNHVLGLLPIAAGTAGAAAHGTEGGVAAALATMLLNKYGSQAGARLLYSPVAGGLGLASRGLSAALPYASAASAQLSPEAEALVSALRRRSQPTSEDTTP